MSDPYIGEIKIFAGNFAPRGWALCDGQLLAISSNDALFSLFGTMYGGDGRTTFGLPDLRGRLPIHQGSGPGLTNRRVGDKFGAETHMLIESELPAHNHSWQASGEAADDQSPAGNVTATSTSANIYGDGALVTMNANTLGNTGGGQSHNNTMPFQCLNFIVALYGVYPSRH